MPSRSEVETGLECMRSRNVTEFGDYGKFAANTAITFGDPIEK